MELGPCHCSTRAETRYNNNKRQHHNHDAVLEHWVRPTVTSSLGEFLPNLPSKFLLAFLIYFSILLKEKNLKNQINIFLLKITAFYKHKNKIKRVCR